MPTMCVQVTSKRLLQQICANRRGYAMEQNHLFIRSPRLSAHAPSRECLGLLISALARCTRQLRASDDRQAGSAPFRQTIFEPASGKPALSQRCNRFIGEHAIRAAAVRNNFF